MTIAMLFPGQGSQSLGMQSELALQYGDVKDTYAEASDLLGYDLWALVQDGPAEELNNTVITQPAMLAAGVATWRVWRRAGGAMPAYMAGHSLGEYTALVCSGALDFSAAVSLVKCRAELMQDAVPAGEGAMAAILMLVFKDTILSFVAGIQLSSNKMVQVGDWIEMPKYGVDGDVIDISLTTVKVQNFDKTIMTVPPYALVTDSFKNWRGMSDAGVRRIKRPIYLDMTSVKFCDEEMINRFKKIKYISRLFGFYEA